ncbi:MAG: hypothetical protein OEZ59_09735 [Deltaproteobacteria bacterium]|nr:hypothetical protein [Deltaproteobacteria bacterium]
MEINKRLVINGRKGSLIRDEVTLGLSQVGSGRFQVWLEQPPPQRGVAEFYVGVAGQQEYLVLVGALTSVESTQPGQYKIEVSELTMSLAQKMVINMRWPTVRDVISRVEDISRLHFLLPAGAVYLDEKRPSFTSGGTALDALGLLASKWELPGSVWYQLPDGRVYWGHWASGPYTRSPVPIKKELLRDLDESKNYLSLPYIPALRPGMVVESSFRFRLDRLVFGRDRIGVYWTKV